MAVPTKMADLSTTANSNSPQGGESPISTDDFHRAIQSILRHTQYKGADIASATTTDIGAATGGFVDITGTTTITGLGTVAAGIERTVRFTGILTLTHNATSLILPGGISITTAADDGAVFRSLGSGNWYCVVYRKASGAILAQSINSLPTVTAVSADYVAIADASDSFNAKKALVSDIAALAQAPQMQDIDATVAANALTVTLNPCTLDFRSTTLTDGTPVRRSLTVADSVVVPNTATLGTVNAVAARLAVLAIDNAGTIEAAIVNLAGGNNLDETTLISTTTISTGADSNNVIYSTTGRTNVAFRVVGFIDITEAAAGVWATAPTLVQGSGGNALTSLMSTGFSQTWQSVTRTDGVTYYNTTGKPISISVLFTQASSSSTRITIGGVSIATGNIGTIGGNGQLYGIIPPGQSYVVTDTGTNTHTTFELR